MSASNEWDEWHLTPNGWVEGSEKVDFAGITERPLPADRVVTFRLTSYMGSIYSKVQISWDEQWCSQSADVEALYQQFGRYPKQVDPKRLTRS